MNCEQTVETDFVPDISLPEVKDKVLVDHAVGMIRGSSRRRMHAWASAAPATGSRRRRS